MAALVHVHDVEGDTGTGNSLSTSYREFQRLTSVVVKIWRTELRLVGEERLIPWGLNRDMGFLMRIDWGVISTHIVDRSRNAH